MDRQAFDAHFYDDLNESRAEAWRLLVRGAADRRSPLHTIQVATIGLNGAPQLRTVVLRSADPAAAALRFHTDSRSPKLAELSADPRVAAVGYDPGAKIQIRLSGTATIHGDDAVADAAWAATRPGSRVCYRAPLAPGAPLDRPDDGAPDAAAREGRDPEAGRAAFRAVTIAVDRLDWLYLAARGHRRAAFERACGWRGAWLAP